MPISKRVQWTVHLADELLLMAPTMDQLSRHVTEWRASILDKGLKVNAGTDD